MPVTDTRAGSKDHEVLQAGAASASVCAPFRPPARVAGTWVFPADLPDELSQDNPLRACHGQAAPARQHS